MSKQNGFFASVLVLSFLVLLPTLMNGWTNLDDPIYIIENPMIKKLSWESIQLMFTTLQVNGSYNPIVLLSWAVDYSILGLDPRIFHFTNLLIHLTVVGLVYYLSFKLSKNIKIAFLTSLLFSIHPMHMEAIAWVTARKDLLYTLFYILGLIMYFNYQDPKYNTSRWKYFILCILFYILSLLSKGSALTFPVVLLAMDYLNKRKDLKLLILEKIPLFILSIVFTIISIKAQKMGEALQFREFYSIIDSLSVGFYGYLVYLIKLIIPYQLCSLHPYPTPSGNPVPWYFTASAIPVLLLVTFCITKIKKNRVLVFGFGFFFITLIPVIQVLSFAISVTADRFTYLPYFGLFFIFSSGLVWVFENKPKFKKATILFTIVFFTFLSIKTISYSKTWKNSETVWTRVIEYYPDYFVSYVNRSAFLIKDNRLEEALEDCKLALKLKPDYYLAYYNKGYIYDRWGDNEKALLNYSEAITNKDDFFQAYQNRGILNSNLNRFEDALLDFTTSISIQPKNPFAYLNRATLLKNNQKFNEAIIDANTAISINDTISNVYFVRAICYRETGQINKSIEDFNKVIFQGSSTVNTYKERGILFFNNGDYNSALKDFNSSIKLNDNESLVYIYRSQIFINQSRFEDALYDLSRAEKMDPNNILIYLIRSSIYKDRGDFKTALNEIEKGLMLYPEDVNLINEKENINNSLNLKIE